MDTTLLNSDYLNKNDNIDLLALLVKFEKNFKFRQNHNDLKNKIRPQSQSFINLIYQRQRELRAIENWEESFQKSLQLVGGEYPFELIETKISKFQVLEVEELIDTALVLQSLPPLQKSIKLSGFEVFDPNQFKKYFKDFFSEADLIFDTKSRSLITYKHPKLKQLDKKIQETSKEIRTSLAKVSSKWANDDLLQQNEYDLFDDKFVLPVRSDRYNSQLGRIIYRSNTGNTLFIEPFSLRTLSNKLEELRAELEREIYKLLKKLSECLAENILHIKSTFEYILTVDNIVGRLRCAQQYNLSEPLITSKDNSFIIRGVFNPLIENPIVNDIKIKEGEGGLLISGPNTGGKTVLLKSICLCFILPHLGFYIPAKEAELPLYQQVYFLSHDNQSLEDGLSSFSSEAINYLDVLRQLNSGSIVFIDEIFNSTSSVEASELAVALIKELRHISCPVFLSSHHEALKSRVFEEGILQSGHMGFTEKSSKPTYVFHSGVPGKSFAREVFLEIERKKLEHPRITRWLSQVSTNTKAFNEKIQDLDEIRNEALDFKKKYEELTFKLSQEKDNVKNLLEVEKKKLEAIYEKRWQKLKRDTLDLTEKVKKGKVSNIVKVTEQLNKINQQENIKKEEQKTLSGDIQDNFVEGDSVILKGLNKQGIVTKVQRGKFQVTAGKLKTWVEAKDLLASHDKQKRKKEVHITVSKEKEGRGMLLDGRGMRREAFLNKAETYLLDVLNGDLPFVDIIHGHGDGILKKALYELLKKYSELHADHIEGNMGTTRVELVN